MEEQTQKLIEILQTDQDYHELEKFEIEMQSQISKLTQHGRNSEVIELSKALGFMLKYKPYGVKCSTLLGYSIFLLNPQEGFSFQRHKDLKSELFHIISDLGNGTIFLADNGTIEESEIHDKLKSNYLKESDSLGRFNHPARAGEVWMIDRPGIIHTAIGCNLEEYANISRDHVDRLYDQNEGRPTKYHSRVEILKRIQSLDIPIPKIVNKAHSNLLQTETIAPEVSDSINIFTMHNSDDFSAPRWILNAHSEFKLNVDDELISLYCTKGRFVLLETGSGYKINVSAFDTLLLPPGQYIFGPSVETQLSVLRIKLEKSFPSLFI